MRALLVSTYELGHQPLHVAQPAAALRAAGHEVSTIDLAVEPWDQERFDEADAVAFSVPMHTAMRIAVESAGRLRRDRPDVPIAFYGLYAAVGADRTLREFADRAIAGEYLDDLVEWCASLEAGLTIQTHRMVSPVPDRSTLPALSEYARLAIDGELRVAGYTEASRGCRHRCTHCPIPVVYDGRFRIADVETVVADVSQLVDMGAQHITLGDPDFLNGPAHAVRVLEALNAAFPDITLDITVKVEHVLRHADLWPRFAELGVLFAVSAFESTNQVVLTKLDKGHTSADMSLATKILRSAGIEVRPSLLPFSPWTGRHDLAEIVEFIIDHDLVGNVDPIQLTIALLVPDGSLVLRHSEVPWGAYDPALLSHPWSYQHPELQSLQQRLTSMMGDGCWEDDSMVFRQMARAIGDDAGRVFRIPASRPIPRLTESWFCCAEPNQAQIDFVTS